MDYRSSGNSTFWRAALAGAMGLAIAGSHAGPAAARSSDISEPSSIQELVTAGNTRSRAGTSLFLSTRCEQR